MGNPEAKSERNATLDVLRGVAIFLVLGRHQAYSLMPENAGGVKPLAVMWFQTGWIGVDLFFVLSGFLVGGLLIKEGLKSEHINTRRFLLRRLLKIWPQYLVYAVFALFQAAISYGAILAARNMWPNFFHIQNYRLTPEHHLWSLAVEEHFYLLLTAFLVWLFLRVKKEKHWGVMLRTYVGVAIVTFIFRLLFAPGREPRWSVATPTHFRIDCLLLGVLLAYAWFLWGDKMKKTLASLPVKLGLFAVSALLMAPVFFITLEDTSNFIPVYGFLFLSWASGTILVTCYANDLLKAKVFSFLKFVGFYSYGIYLWHVKCRDLAVFLIDKLHLSPEATWNCGMILYIGLAIVVGIITTRLIELPILKLRERIAA